MTTTAAIQPPHLNDDERNVQRQAFAGLMWSKQLYHYSVQLWLEGDPAFPPPSARTQARSQRRLGAPLQHGCALHAGQVGVSLVRGLGSGLSHDPRRPHRSGMGQAPIAPGSARMVHAPQRPDSCLRVELQRRQSARPRLGRLAGLQDRAQSIRSCRHRFSGKGLPQASAQLHLVGQPQG